MTTGDGTNTTVAVVTGTRAEYGLLRPVMRAIQTHSRLKLHVLATGAHLLPPQRTIDEVAREFSIAATIPMQSPGHVGAIADAEALGRGVTGFAEAFGSLTPDVVLVLGDRIEAFAAATAAAVAGFAVAHMHGGDRAEGIADESLRHAISKLAHLHLAATETSAQRLIAMGEDPQRVHVVGSPAIDGLNEIGELSDAQFESLGTPEIILLLHPEGESNETELARAAKLLEIARDCGRVLALHPNFDPGRNGIVRAIEHSKCMHRAHLPRHEFIGLLRRGTLMVGNSSAGLIECSAIPLRCINIGTRQAGREMPANVINIVSWDEQPIATAIADSLAQPKLDSREINHPYGDGRAGERTAELLADIDWTSFSRRKRNAY